MKNTISVQIADTVFFKHKYITMPTISKADAFVTAASHLAQVLQGEISTNIGETGTQHETSQNIQQKYPHSSAVTTSEAQPKQKQKSNNHTSSHRMMLTLHRPQTGQLTTQEPSR